MTTPDTVPVLGEPLVGIDQLLQVLGGMRRRELLRAIRDKRVPAPAVRIGHRFYWRHSTILAWVGGEEDRNRAS